MVRSSRAILKASVLALVAGLTLAMAPAPTLAQAPTQAEITFWTSIQNSKNAAEYEAYLQAFPNGTFAPLARLRVQQLGGGGGSPPPREAGPGPGGNGEPPGENEPPRQQANTIDTTDPEVVRQVQIRLYNLNYQLQRQDGVWDAATRKAVGEWQQRTKRESTGILTRDEWQALQNARIPAVWGAVAYTANGTVGRSWNRASRLEAEQDAIGECQKRAGRRAKCDTLAAADAACLAVATYRARSGETIYYGARVSLQPTLAQAISNALQQCQDAPRSRDTCANRISICANGSHQSGGGQQ
jgi:peptidoglycan hydrolase-like protein with peptidoglycan-binding domain